MWRAATVGERALAAVELGNGECACYYSQWGGTPSAVSGVFNSSKYPRPETTLTVYDWQYESQQPWSSVVDTLDYLQFEAVYRLSNDGIGVYLPVWLGFGRDQRTDPATGVLVAIRSAAEYTWLDARIREWKTELGDAVESGRMRLAVAERTLCKRLAGRERIVPERVSDRLL